MFNLNNGVIGYILDKCNYQPATAMFIPVIIASLLFVMAVGYLLGSVNSAIVISKLLYRDDIRRHGSGNAGLTNMLRTYGKSAAGLTLLGDLLKTAISIFIAGIVGGFGYANGVSYGGAYPMIPFVYIAGLFSVLGHIFPIYYNFKGGKGVLCTAVMALILTPIEFLLLLVIFALLVSTTKYVSLGSVTVAALYPVVLNGHFLILKYQNGLIALVAIVLAIIIFWCHRENLKRISEGKERRISIGKSPKAKADAEVAAPEADTASDASEDNSGNAE